MGTTTTTTMPSCLCDRLCPSLPTRLLPTEEALDDNSPSSCDVQINNAVARRSTEVKEIQWRIPDDVGIMDMISHDAYTTGNLLGMLRWYITTTTTRDLFLYCE